MVTLLLDHLRTKFGFQVPVNSRIGIVGTDKADYSPLLELYQYIENHYQIQADCFSAYLINANLDNDAYEYQWSDNEFWLNIALVSRPDYFYIAHDKVNQALVRAVGGVGRSIANVHDFVTAMPPGADNPSFKEVKMLIENGYRRLDADQDNIPLPGSDPQVTFFPLKLSLANN